MMPLEDFLNQLSPEELERLNSNKNEHSVIVHFIYYRDSLDPLIELEEKLTRAIEQNGVGRHDGHEIAMDDSDGFLYMYGPNAEELFKVVKPVLEECEFTRGATAFLRFGGWDSEAPEIEVEIGK